MCQWVGVVLFLMLPVSIAIQAGEQRGHDESIPRPKIHREVWFGGYHCSATTGSATANISVRFSGTPGITERDPLVTRSSVSTDAPVAACDADAARLRDAAERLGCTTGRIDSFAFPTTESRSFNFVCHGDHNVVMRMIGKLSEEVLTAAP